MAATLDTIFDEIAAIQRAARVDGARERPRWPLLVLRNPKGWTCPSQVDGLQVEGTWRSHHVALSDVRANPDHLRVLEEWLRSYRPEELFDGQGRLQPFIAELAPAGPRRMGANPHANGDTLLTEPQLPDFRRYGVDVVKPGTTFIEPTPGARAGCCATSSR